MSLPDQITTRLQRELGILFPSAALCVRRDNAIVAETYLQSSAESVYDLASLTKVCATTPAILQLCARGALALDAAASEWLPALRTTTHGRITIRQLLTHTSGLPAWRPLYAKTRNRNDVAAVIAAQSLQSRPGTRRCYSDLGFLLLGFLIEAVAHQRLDVFCNQHLFRPHQLQRIGFLPPHTAAIMPTSVGNPYEQALLHQQPGQWSFADWRTDTVCGTPNDGNAHYAMHGVAGHAGLFGTARTIAALLTSFDPDMLRTALTANAHGQGLGWWMDNSRLGVRGLPAGAGAHFGFTGCFASIDPHTNTAIALLTNKQQMGLDAHGQYPDLKSLVSDVLCALA